MIKKSSLLLSDRIDYEELVKEAFLGGLMANVGKVIVRNPMKSLGTAATVAFNGSDILSAGRRASNMANKNRNLMNSLQSVPTNM